MTQHLTLEERWQIKALVESGNSLRSIARQLKRSVSTISAERRRGSLQDGRYSPKRGIRLYHRGKLVSGRTRRKLTGALWTCVRHHLLHRWSPEQIAGRLRLEGIVQMSHTTIYRRLWRERHPSLLRCLRHGGRRYRKGQAGRTLIPNRVDIKDRPKIVEAKTRIGDWEADTIVGAKQQGAIVSLVDRASKYTKLRHVPEKKAEAVTQAIVSALKPHKNNVHTITYDNGCEFVQHRRISRGLFCQAYFATPYHSWERGLNEHTNGLVRQFFPKGQSLTNIFPAQLQAVENLLNNRPRKALHYLTPAEVFFNQPSTNHCSDSYDNGRNLRNRANII